MSLADEFQKLVDAGMIVPTVTAPLIVPQAEFTSLRTRTFYSVAEASAYKAKRDAKLATSSRRNSR